jgi:hypothetical protein
MEKRKRNALKGSPIPADYAKMVADVFTSNFDEGLKKLNKTKGAKAHFEVYGELFPDEVLMAVSVVTGKELSATTVYGSVDYDPKASFPQVQDLLSACVDAIGSVFEKGKLEVLAETSLADLDGVPFDWTAVVVERFKVHVKIDKANLGLDQMADDWLNKNDPGFQERALREEQESEKLFMTGEEQKAKVTRKPGGGKIH